MDDFNNNKNVDVEFVPTSPPISIDEDDKVTRIKRRSLPGMAEMDSGNDAGLSSGDDNPDGSFSRFSTMSRRSSGSRKRVSIDAVPRVHPDKKKEAGKPVRTLVITALCWQVLLSVATCLPFVLLTVFVPLLNVVTIPVACILIVVLSIDLAFVAYLMLAQDDPPAHVSLPFLPWDVKLVWKVNVVLWTWFRVGVRLIPAVLADWSVRRVLSTRADTNWGRYDIRYGSQRARKRLDVYRASKLTAENYGRYSVYPQLDTLKRQQLEKSTRLRRHSIAESTAESVVAIESSSSESASPIIVFIYSPHLGPIRSKKWMYESLGRNLSALGYAVVIADITHYPEGKAKQMVQDIRRVMNWAYENASKFGGDPNRIYLMGHSLGAHLSLLTVLQEVVVDSREAYLDEEGADVEMSNGLRQIRVYSPEVRIPRIQGLILLAPICDVNDQIIQEAHRGVSHLSKLRRILGPTHTTAMFHSPAHVLHASRNVVNVTLLPPKVLFIHGGLDDEVHHSQSEMMKEMMRGVGMTDVRVRVYPVGHVDVVTSLMMKMNELCSPYVLDELTSFIPL